jgi:cytochrome P450
LKDDFADFDYFTDMSIADNPFPYFEFLRSQGQVVRLPHRESVAVLGHEEALQVYRDADTFSSIVATAGPLTPLGFVPSGDDISDEIDRHRAEIPMSDRMVHMDFTAHSRQRSILNRLFTPSRLKDNEKFTRRLADSMIDRFIEKGKFEVMSDYGQPFSGMVIADLLGVPEEDHPWFEACFSGRLPTFEGEKLQHDLFRAVAPKFAEYTIDRRANPREDVTTDLATATFPDGELPSVDEVSMLAAALFTAGQDTTARLLGAALQVIAQDHGLQDRLRDDLSLIPDFVEECLRFDGPVKTSNRLVRKSTTLGGLFLKAGTVVSLFNGAINRDPARFPSPDEFRLGRPKAKEHVAFGRGPHTCIGAPLARAEVIISFERLLERLRDISISEDEHGPAGQRQFHHEPHYILRGLKALHLTFNAA